MNKISRGFRRLLITALFTLGLFGQPGLQAQTLKPYIGADTTQWNQATSWSGASLPLTNDNVSFRTTATGTNVFNLTSGFTLTTMGVASRTLDSTSTGSVTMGTNLSGNTLNARNLTVGELNLTGNYTGSWSPSNGTFNLSNGALQVGVRSGTNTGAGVGNGTITGASNLNFNATNLTSLRIGTSSSTSGAGVGTLNFTAISQGTLSVQGGADTVIIGGRIGGSTGSMGGTGTVTLGNNWDSTSFGTAGTRADVRIGYRTSNGPATGTLTQSGGTFTTYANNFSVAGSSNLTDPTSISGTVNLTGTSSALIDATNLQIANASIVSAVVTGSLTLGSGGQIVAGTTVVGRSGSTSATTQASLTLGNASLTVASSGTLTVNQRGQVDATVGLANDGINLGGLIIANPSAAALTINSLTTDSRGVQLTFGAIDTAVWELGDSANFDAIYYALKWNGGDRTSTINSFISGNKISSNYSAIGVAPSVFLQGGDTYYGYYLRTRGPLNAWSGEWLGMNVGYATVAATQSVVNDFNAVGLGAIRRGGNVPSNTTYTQDLANQDSYINTMFAADLEIHWIVNYRGYGVSPAGTALANLPGININGATMALWFNNYKARCIDLFTRYSSPGNVKILHYIVGNEPNLSDPFTTLHGRPDIAVRLTQAMYEAAQQVNPNIFVESPPVSQPDTPYLQEMINLGVANYCDVIGVHIYADQTHGPRIEKPWVWLQAAGVTNKPVGVSEAGVTIGWNPIWSTNARQWQSDWLNNFYIMAKRYGYSYGLLFTHDDDHSADWALMRVAGAQVQPSWNELDNTLTNPQGLRNAGFETPNDRLRQWYPEHSPTTNWPTGFNWQFATNPRSGTYCAQIRTNNGWDTSAYQVVDNLIPGATYRVTGWIRSESPSGGLFYIAGSQAYNGIQTFNSSLVTTNTWTQVSVDVVPTNPWIVISLTTKKNPSPSFAYFDDISVTKLSGP